MRTLTDFKQKMQKHASKLGILLGLMFFTVGAFQANAQTYCTPSACCSNARINEVTLGNITNTTNAMSSGGYGDFTNSVSAPVFQRGDNVNYSVDISFAGDDVNIWVDWNKDGTFTRAVELNNTSSTNTGSFSVPNNAATGNIRVRVEMTFSDDNDPCTNGFDETEDYHIFIDLPAGEDAAITSINQPSTPNAEGGCDLTSNEAIDVTVSSIRGDAIDTVPVNYQINNGSIVQDTVYSNISGGGSQDFIFDQTANLSAYDSSYKIKVWTDYDADTIPSNDTLTKTVTKFGVIDEPYLETFEGENNCAIGGNCASNGSCGLSGQWVNGMLNDDMDWSVKRGPTETSNSGPVYDHTKGIDFFPDGFDYEDNVSGSYIFTEADGCNNSTAYLMSYCMDADQFDSAYLSFWYHMYGNDMGNLEVQVDTGGSWNTIWSVSGEQQTAASAPWQKGEVILPQNGVYNIRFAGNTGGGNNSDIALDDIRIDNFTACEAPSDLEVMDYSSDSVKVAWKPGDSANTDWNVQYGTAGFTLGNGTTISASDSSAWLTGLGGDSVEYEYYVQENCANDDTSYWSTRGTFTPDCDPVEDTLMESQWEVANQQDATIMPFCWNPVIDVTDPYTIGLYMTTIYNNFNGNTPDFLMANQGQNQADDFIGVSSRPLSDLSSNARRVRFDAWVANTSNKDDLIIGTMSNRADPNTFEGHDTVNAADLTGSPQQFTFPLTSVPADHEYLVFKHGATNSSNAFVYIDNIKYTHLPSCDAPANLTVDSMRHDSAWVSWNSGDAPDNEWYIEYGKKNAGDDTLITGLTDSTFVISGLTEATSYEVRVREKCGQGISEFIGPVKFTTPCRVRKAPWHENFARGSSGFNTYPCWNFIENGDVSIDLASTGPNGAPPFPVAGTHFIDIWRSGSAGNGFIVTPELKDLDKRINQIRFHANADEPFLPSAKDTGSIIVGTMTDPSNPSTFTAMDSVLIRADDNWHEYNFWLHPYNVGDGNYLALKMGSYERQMYLDSIVYETIPDCSVGLYADTIYGWSRNGAYGFNGFDGTMKAGTMNSPDSICMGDSAVFDLTAPFGFSDDDYGTEWEVASVTAQTQSGVSASVINEAPSGSERAQVGFIPNAIVEDSVVQVDVHVDYTNIGCDTTLTRYVHVAPSPSADFAFDNNLCARNDINLVNNSTNVTSASTFNWSFGDGSTSQAVNPRKAYDEGGQYDIQLDVTNKFGCKDSYSSNVDVNYNPHVGYTNSASEICLGQNINFDDTTNFGGSGNLTYNWDFDDGNTETGETVDYAFTSSGSYDVKLTVNSDQGCMDSMVKTIRVNDTPNVAFSAQNVCLGKEVDFSNNSGIANNNNLDYTWHFGDGETSGLLEPDHHYDTAGQFDVKLIATSPNGCKDSVTNTVTVYPKPEVGFTMSNEEICLGQNVDFTDTTRYEGSSSFLSNTWEFGDGSGPNNVSSPSYQYLNSGRYDVKLIVTSGDGCVDSASKPVTVNDTPSVDFTTPEICAGETAQFANNSSIAGGSLNYEWEFHDGMTIDGQKDAAKNYNSPNVNGYDVKLVATSSLGCKDSVTKQVVVNHQPVADFNASNVCDGGTVSFTDNSSVTNANITSREWHFGDGGLATGQNPDHTYSDTGNYEVSLIVTSDKGCQDTATQMIRVNPVPEAGFTAENVCMGDSVSFMDQTDLNGSHNVEYTWDFGDGQTESGNNVDSPKHYYQQPGTYTVTLTVENDSGCMDMVQQDVTVSPQPDAEFTTSAVCEGSTLMITDQTDFNGGSGSFLNYEYTVNGDFLSSNPSPSIRDIDTGTYEIALTVTANNGCSSTFDTTIEVLPKPEPAFSAQDVCLNNAVNFNNMTAYKGSADSLTYTWHYGNGVTENGVNPQYDGYDTAGTYNVKLVVTSNNGCVDSVTEAVTVRPIASSDFSFTNNIDTAMFEAADTTGISYQWDFGDGNTTFGMNPVHTYDSSGEYDVTLTVYNDNGCRTRTVQTISMQSVGYEDAVESFATDFEVYPNPFEGSALIEYSLKDASQVKLEVFNASGKRLETIANGQQQAGAHNYRFRADGASSASIYFIRLTVDGGQKVKKLIRAQ